MEYTAIPTQSIGPVKILGDVLNDTVHVPLATFETTLWPSTNRGAKATRKAGGITCTIISDQMTRAIMLEADTAHTAARIKAEIETQIPTIKGVIQQTSQYAVLQHIHCQIVSQMLIVRISIQSGDASGHNMVTKAADQVMQWLLSQYAELRYVSVSANCCTDKKVSAINATQGRGKHLIAEVVIPYAICQRILKVEPSTLVACHLKKNLIGSIQAGSLLSANAHFANLLLATYLATGQDAANIVEGSQGMTHAECRDDDLYFSVNLPNLIVGTVGHGKHHPHIQHHLETLGCLEPTAKPGANSQRLAAIIAATVLCGELSLMAALTNPGELMRSHITFERTGSATCK